MVILLTLTSVVGAGVFSFFVNPIQFLLALIERICRILAKPFILFIRLIGVALGSGLVAIRFSLGLMIGIDYSISPIDIIPDLLPWVGHFDDLAIFLGGIFGGLFGMGSSMTGVMHKTARRINQITKVMTKFP